MPPATSHCCPCPPLRIGKNHHNRTAEGQSLFSVLMRRLQKKQKQKTTLRRCGDLHSGALTLPLPPTSPSQEGCLGTNPQLCAPREHAPSVHLSDSTATKTSQHNSTAFHPGDKKPCCANGSLWSTYNSAHGISGPSKIGPMSLYICALEPCEIVGPIEISSRASRPAMSKLGEGST